MNNILKEPLELYLAEKKKAFGNNPLAKKIRQNFRIEIENIIPDKERYKVIGSAGQGNWAECPWIAILDRLITESPQSGFYPVLIFKADMTGVYLSLNQGITEVRDNYKRDAKKVLTLRAYDYRAKLDYNETQIIETISLNSSNSNAKLYEAGNIIAKYYPTENLPSSNQIQHDIIYFLNLYEELTFNDTQLNENIELDAIEKKQYRLHFRIERNSSISKKVKQAKGYKCEGCGFKFISKYGELGKDFIEAHHLTPISSLNIGNTKINIMDDFAVLCSNCHSMIHRLSNPSDLNQLKKIIELHR